MSTHFEITWQMYGLAKVEASNAQEAISHAARELIHWSGTGVDLIGVEVDGADVEEVSE